MPTAQFKSHHCSKTLLMYSVKIIGDHLEREDKTASKIPQSMCCNCKADFKLIVTKCLEENNTLWNGNSMSQNKMLQKTKNYY